MKPDLPAIVAEMRDRAEHMRRDLGPWRNDADADAIDAWADAIESAMAQEREGLYEQLLYAVESKFPGETRHQTALRYIRQAEFRCTDEGSAAAPTGGSET